MSDTPIRNRSIRQLCLATAVGAIVAGLVLIGFGIYLLRPPVTDTRGAILLAGGIFLVVFALFARAEILLSLKTEATVNRLHHDLLDMLDVVRRTEPMLKTVSENSQISDAARSIAHREQEREALRQAIREEMYSGDWEAAHYLIEQMERRFGYMQEAKTLRSEMAQIREMTIEEKINDVISHIEGLMKEQRWDRARQESERLLKLFPRHEKVLSIPGELNRRREAHKQDLLQRWRLAVERNEIDNGIAILTELDQYLAREEAQNLRDSARHVFKARLLNLGVQFSLAVSESRWRDALETGLQLQQEFPNSRMAQEVAEKTEALRVRAGFVTDADVIQQRKAQPAQ